MIVLVRALTKKRLLGRVLSRRRRLLGFPKGTAFAWKETGGLITRGFYPWRVAELQLRSVCGFMLVRPGSREYSRLRRSFFFPPPKAGFFYPSRFFLLQLAAWLIWRLVGMRGKRKGRVWMGGFTVFLFVLVLYALCWQLPWILTRIQAFNAILWNIHQSPYRQRHWVDRGEEEAFIGWREDRADRLATMCSRGGRLFFVASVASMLIAVWPNDGAVPFRWPWILTAFASALVGSLLIPASEAYDDFSIHWIFVRNSRTLTSAGLALA